MNSYLFSLLKLKMLRKNRKQSYLRIEKNKLFFHFGNTAIVVAGILRNILLVFRNC